MPDGEVASGYGVNQLTMMDMSEDGALNEWRILSGIDEQADVEGCAGFVEV